MEGADDLDPPRFHLKGPAAVKRTADRAPRAIAPRQDPTRAHLRKLDQSDVTPTPRTLAVESRQTLVRARVALKLSQAALNTQLSLPANTIKGIESGHLQPTPAQMQRINRWLNQSAPDEAAMHYEVASVPVK